MLSARVDSSLTAAGTKSNGSEEMQTILDSDGFVEAIKAFDGFGSATLLEPFEWEVAGRTGTTMKAINEYWTSKQRQAHSLHEISYRACYKPQLPQFFIERLSEEGDVVYDPFNPSMRASWLGCPNKMDPKNTWKIITIILRITSPLYGYRLTYFLSQDLLYPK